MPETHFGKVASLRPATLSKKSLWHWCFPENFVKFLRTPFITKHLRWLLLKQVTLSLDMFSFRNIHVVFERIICTALHIRKKEKRSWQWSSIWSIIDRYLLTFRLSTTWVYNCKINLFLPTVHFWSPKNIRKPNIFWCFQGGSKGNIGKERVKCIWAYFKSFETKKWLLMQSNQETRINKLYSLWKLTILWRALKISNKTYFVKHISQWPFSWCKRGWHC